MLLINNEVLFGQKEEAIVLFAVERWAQRSGKPDTERKVASVLTHNWRVKNMISQMKSVDS